MAIRVGGIAFVKVNGQAIPLRGNLTIHPTERERTGVAGQDGVHGFTENPRVPAIEGDLTSDPGFSIQDALDINDATVQAECANGRVYVLEHAWQAGVVDLNTVEGSAKFRWEGRTMTEYEGGVI